MDRSLFWAKHLKSEETEKTAPLGKGTKGNIVSCSSVRSESSSRLNKNEKRATRRKSTGGNQVEIVQRATQFLPPSKVEAHGKANL